MTSTTSQPAAAIPPDDANNKLTVANPDDPKLRHVSVAGGTYTILVSGEQTGGRYCLIDMLVPAGGGPPPHRHDFEEMFTILDGEIELTFRGEVQRANTGSTVNVPANAPHSFKNMSDKPARLLCMCTPAGQEEFFMAVGDPVDSRTAPPPQLRILSGPSASNAPRRSRPNIEPSCWYEGTDCGRPNRQRDASTRYGQTSLELYALQSGHSSRVHAPSYRSMPRETVDPLKVPVIIYGDDDE